MVNVLSIVATIRKGRRGVTAVEYGIMASLIAIALIAAMGTFGGALTAEFTTFAGQMTATK